MVVCPDYHAIACSAMHHGTTQADVIRWIGIVISVIGAAVTAASGLGWLLQLAKDFLTRLGRGSWRWIRTFFGRHRGKSPGTSALDALTQITGTLRTDAEYGWKEDETVEQKVERLHGNVTSLRKDVNELVARNDSDHKEIEDRLRAQERRLNSEVHRIEGLIQGVESDAARADGRGLIPVMFGIVLLGIPDGLADHGFVGWPLAGTAIIATLVVVGAAWKDARRRVG